MGLFLFSFVSLKNNAMERDIMRERLSLRGRWDALCDHDNEGKNQGWITWPPKASDQAGTLTVPGLWNQRWPDFAGAVFYHRRFGVPDAWRERRVTLNFDGANYFTEAWLNGVYLGAHEGGYTPFSFDIDANIDWKNGNTLVLRVVDPPREGSIDGMTLAEVPCSKETWYRQFGGIHGDVFLESTARCFIESMHIEPNLSQRTVTFRATASGDTTGPARVAFEVVDAEGAILAFVEKPCRAGNAAATISLPNAPIPWTTNRPYLYEGRARLIADGLTVDEQNRRFGMRDVAIRGGRFYLNDEQLVLKGVLLQPDYPLSIVLPGGEVARRELEMMKAAGVNLVRCHVRPAPTMYLDLADELGLLVYQETAAGFLADSEHAKRRCETEIREMIQRDRNHPSIVIWGILNEAPSISAELRRELLKYSRRFDTSRPVIDNSGMAIQLLGDQALVVDETSLLTPGSDEPKPFVDVHFYPWCPINRRTQNWLSKVGSIEAIDGEDILSDRPGTRDAAHDVLRNHVIGERNAIFVSEYGTGGLTNLDSVIERFGEHRSKRDGGWFIECRELADAFLQTIPQAALGDRNAFVSATQAIQATGLKRMTESLRANPDVSGFVVTQWNDSHFEQYAGVVDPWRVPKKAYHMLGNVFAPFYITIRPETMAPTANTNLSVAVTVINDEGFEGPAELTCELHDHDGACLSRISDVFEMTSGILPTIKFDCPTIPPGELTIVARVTIGAQVLAENREVVRAYQKPDFNALECKVARIAPDERLNTFLKSRQTSFEEADVLLVEQPECVSADEIEPAVRLCESGKTLVIMNLSAELDLFHDGPYPVRELFPALPFSEEAVILPAGSTFIPRFHYLLEDSLFAGLPSNMLLCEQFGDMIPPFSIGEPEAETAAGLIAFKPDFRLVNVSGHFSDVARRKLGKGVLVFNQYPIRDQIDANPVAQHMLYNMLKAGRRG